MAPNTEPEKKLSEEEILQQKEDEREARHEAAVLSRKEWDRKKIKKERRLIALSLLEKQLKDDTKPVKGIKPFKMKDGTLNWSPFAPQLYPEGVEWEVLKDGTKKAVRVSIVPLTYDETVKITKQINSLKDKLGIA